MYLLTVKDGLVTRYIGPYLTPQKASDDLERVLSSCTDRARWQIHALETPYSGIFNDRIDSQARSITSAVA